MTFCTLEEFCAVASLYLHSSPGAMLMSAVGHRPWWVYVSAVATLAVLLWAGWSDFTPWVPRGVVQEAIRGTIRQVIQIVVQYVAPVLLIGFLAREGFAAVTSRRRA